MPLRTYTYVGNGTATMFVMEPVVGGGWSIVRKTKRTTDKDFSLTVREGEGTDVDKGHELFDELVLIFERFQRFVYRR